MTGDELDVFERSVVDVARHENEPSPIQRSRVRYGLTVKLAAGAATLSVGTTALATVLKVGATMALAGGLAVSGYYAATEMRKKSAAPMPTRNAPATSAKVAVAEDPAPETDVTPEAATTPPAPTPTPVPAIEPRTERRPSRPANAAKSASPDLAAELAMLGQAKAAIEQGQAHRAGEILHAYDRTFRRGLLAEERMATGILYLCAVGQIDAARAETGRFVNRFPHSPLRQRVERSCTSAGEARP